LAKKAEWYNPCIANLFCEFILSTTSPKERLHILRFVGNVWVFHIYPVAHLFCKVVPLFGISKHGFLTSFVVFFDAYFLPYIFFGNA
jgi:hypothetical protein